MRGLARQPGVLRLGSLRLDSRRFARFQYASAARASPMRRRNGRQNSTRLTGQVVALPFRMQDGLHRARAVLGRAILPRGRPGALQADGRPGTVVPLSRQSVCAASRKRPRPKVQFGTAAKLESDCAIFGAEAARLQKNRLSSRSRQSRSPRGAMTDYHAEGVKLLAYVPARSLPSALTKSPLASAAPPTTTASQIFSLRSMTPRS